MCSVPVVIGHYWIRTVAALPGLIASGCDGRRRSWVLLARFDSNKGAPSLDQTFRAPGATVVGISLDRHDWPLGKGSRAIVHGALLLHKIGARVWIARILIS